jgi:archaellum biogenesis ATPase FlaH
MKTLTTRKDHYALIIMFLTTFCLHAQSQNITIDEDPKFNQLLGEKRKINTSLNINDSYKIQIFNGSNENAKKILNEFKQSFFDLDATIIFNTPNYKVWIGNFKTRIEAENFLLTINKRFKNTLLIRPNK